jgi:hypothetical protein
MKNRLTLALSAAALFVSAGLLVWTLWGLAATPAAAPVFAAETAAPIDAAQAYRLEKLNAVNDMVLSREVVQEDYLRYLPEDLAEEVRMYNQETAGLYMSYASYAKDTADALFYEHKESPGDYDQPELYYEWVGRIARLALYRNTNELCENDPLLVYPLAKEAGGSYGMWAQRIHNQPIAPDPEVNRRCEDYFTLIDALLARFDAARAALT